MPKGFSLYDEAARQGRLWTPRVPVLQSPPVFVGGLTANKAGATSGNTTISLTALTGGIEAAARPGDIVIAAFATGSAADRTLLISDGTVDYTLIDAEQYANGSSSDTNLRVARKIMGATADTTTTFGPTGNAADGGAMAVSVYRDFDPTTPFDVAAVPANGTGTGRPDPGAITPVTPGALPIVAGGGASGTGAVFTASELSGFVTNTGADNNDGMVGIGYFPNWDNRSAYDPAQWTGGTTGAGDSWASMTMALRPRILPGGNMLMWLDAADYSTIVCDGSGNVSDWEDKSGKGNHATQSNASLRPAWKPATGPKGNPGLLWGSTHALHAALSTAYTGQKVTAYIVCQMNSGSADYAGLLGGTATAGGSQGDTLAHWGLLRAANLTQVAAQRIGQYANATIVFGDLMLVAAVYDGSATHFTVLDGTASSTAGGGSASFDFSFIEIGTVGLVGYIQEAIVEGGYSLRRREIVEGYLAWKWGLKDKLPASHRFKHRPPMIGDF